MKKKYTECYQTGNTYSNLPINSCIEEQGSFYIFKPLLKVEIVIQKKKNILEMRVTNFSKHSSVTYSNSFFLAYAYLYTKW